MICSSLLKDYIFKEKLRDDDYIFKVYPKSINQYLRRLAKRVLGDGVTKAGQKYSDLTMYDFRHISSCYWRPRYKVESALMYRFGWKKAERVHYYSEFLGMQDTIQEDDLLIDNTKTNLEQNYEKAKRDNELMQEKMIAMEKQMGRILERVEGVIVEAR